jgi:hypothetical protein
MHSLALFIVELQTARRRLIRIFDEPDGTSKDRPRNPPYVQRAEIARTFDSRSAVCVSCGAVATKCRRGVLNETHHLLSRFLSGGAS